MSKKSQKRKLWSVPRIRDPRHPQFLVRMTEMQKDGPLYVVVRGAAPKPFFRQIRPKVTRLSLGATEAERVKAARAIALDYIERLAAEPEDDDKAGAGGALTLTQLADKYEVDGFHGRTEGYKKNALSSIRRVAKFLGPDKRPVASIKPSDVQRYLAHREDVRVAAHRDLVQLKIAINWAIGEGLADANPLASPKAARAMKPEGHEKRRPVADRDRVGALQRVAADVDPALPVLLSLAWHTGRRISAILGLRWSDVTLEETRWR